MLITVPPALPQSLVVNVIFLILLLLPAFTIVLYLLQHWSTFLDTRRWPSISTFFLSNNIRL